MPTLATARSFLFAPGSEPRKLERALASDADAVVADLEDAVLPADKERAREDVARAMTETTGSCLRLVRVNGAGTPWHDGDVAALAGLDLDGVVLPKATPDGLGAVAEARLPVVAIVESAAGLRGAFEVASAPAVEALVLGAVDLGLELGLQPLSDGAHLLHARSTLVVDSAAAEIRPPIDQVWVDVRDDAGLASDCALARSLGMRGKACVHPRQVAIVNEAFAPSADEVARARAVVAAYEEASAEGRGAVAVDGEMIDLPVVERARSVLAEAKRSVLHVD